MNSQHCFKCECTSEIVNVERNIEIIDKKNYDVQIYFAMFHYGTQNQRPTLREKLRHCFQILKTGKNYSDNVILSTENARKLAQTLLTLIDEENVKEEVEKLMKGSSNA